MHPRNPMGRIVHSSVYAFLPTTFLQLGIYEAYKVYTVIALDFRSEGQFSCCIVSFHKIVRVV